MSKSIVRVSSWRHVFGEPAKPEKSFLDVRPSFEGDSNHIAASTKFFAYGTTGGGGPVVVHPLAAVGRVGATPPRIMVHKGAVLDMEFNPFVPHVIATASDDSSVKITAFPEGGLTGDITKETASLDGHERKATVVHWSPTTNGLLASASADNTLRVWDALAASAVSSFGDFTDSIYSFDWKEDGSAIAASSKDALVRVYDPRDAKAVIKTEGFLGSKPSRVLWAGPNRLVGTGFGKGSERQYVLWDVKKLDKPITRIEMDKSPGMVVPYYDADTSILYVAPKGGSSISYFEINDSAPFVHALDSFGDNNSQKSVCWLPKRLANAGAGEIALCLRLMKDSVVPIAFKVPRKNEAFNATLWPDAYAGVAAQDVKQWAAGGNAAAPKMSMNPKDKSAAGAESKAEFKVDAASSSPSSSAASSPSGGDLAAKLAAAQARIKELEEENKRLQEQLAAKA